MTPEAPPPEILDALRRMRLLGDESAMGERLTGGVSSDIWRIDAPSGPICVKRALAKLRVAADWRAPVERNLYEARWMQRANAAVPGSAPALLGQDEAGGGAGGRRSVRNSGRPRRWAWSEGLGYLLQLAGALRPTVMKTHLLVPFAVFGRPMQHPGGIFRFAISGILENQNGGHERLRGRLPRARVGVREDQLFARNDFKIETWIGELLAGRAWFDCFRRLADNRYGACCIRYRSTT